MTIQFLTQNYSWDKGYQTEVIDEDNESYYFEDIWHNYVSVDKSLEGTDFKIK